MLKLILSLLFFTVAGGVVINRVPSLKQKVVEFVNPAVHEARVLGELKQNLTQLDGSLTDLANTKNLTELKTKTQTFSNLLAQSQGLLSTATDLNQSSSGVISQTLDKVIGLFVDKTPFPADHLKTTPLVIPVANGTPVICPVTVK